jgi:hypothetical protein
MKRIPKAKRTRDRALEARIAEVVKSDHAVSDLYVIADELKQAGAGLAAVRSILRAMEDNPEGDFGTPGPLVQFIEKFWRAGYEEELLASVRRRPTAHTVWMVNRLINGAKDAEERKGWISILKEVAAHPKADEIAKQQSEDFLAYQLG